jgi:hypothetical protein
MATPRQNIANLLRNNGCPVEGCLAEFETGDRNERHYPHISPLCFCTICHVCIDQQHEAAVGENPKFKGWTIECPVCHMEKAWNIRKLVPNKALANMQEELRWVMNNLAE